ncbi:MAG: AAA family ATPase, partial [Actinomycetota bacterium]
MARRRFLEQMAAGDWNEVLEWHEAQHLWLTDIEMEPVTWLWEGFIPRGMVTLLTGEEGLGKSQLALKVVSEFTKGTFGDEHPDGSRHGGLAKVYTAEDPLRQVLKPRLVANGARLENVAAEGINVQTWLPDGITDIARGIEEVGFGLVVIDPVIAYFGTRHDSNKAQDVREIMRKLAALAEDTGAVIVGVMHPKKGEETSALHKLIGGSSAFGQAARSVLGVCRHPELEDWRVVGRIKGNLDRPPEPRAYEIVQVDLASPAGRVRTSRVGLREGMGTDFDFARAILKAAPSQVERERVTLTDEGVLFLSTELAGETVSAKELLRRAREAGITPRTLHRAKERLGVEVYQRDGAW